MVTPHLPQFAGEKLHDQSSIDTVCPSVAQCQSHSAPGTLPLSFMLPALIGWAGWTPGVFSLDLCGHLVHYQHLTRG